MNMIIVTTMATMAELMNKTILRKKETKTEMMITRIMKATKAPMIMMKKIIIVILK